MCVCVCLRACVCRFVFVCVCVWGGCLCVCVHGIGVKTHKTLFISLIDAVRSEVHNKARTDTECGLPRNSSNARLSRFSSNVGLARFASKRPYATHEPRGTNALAGARNDVFVDRFVRGQPLFVCEPTATEVCVCVCLLKQEKV